MSQEQSTDTFHMVGYSDYVSGYGRSECPRHFSYDAEDLWLEGWDEAEKDTQIDEIEEELTSEREDLKYHSELLREFGREVMLRHRALRKARERNSIAWRGAMDLWGGGRKDLRLYLDAFVAQRELVRGLEIRLARMYD